MVVATRKILDLPLDTEEQFLWFQISGVAVNLVVF